jgi:hypothetical protein
MDGLKLIRRCEEELTNEIQILKTVSNDIKLNFYWRNVTKFV